MEQDVVVVQIAMKEHDFLVLSQFLKEGLEMVWKCSEVSLEVDCVVNW